MTILLEAVRQKLTRRVQKLDAAFDRELSNPHKRRLDRSAYQEGLVSALWQSWCGFCREVLIGSATAAKSVSGHAVTSPYAGHAEMEIAYVAKRLSQGRAVGVVRALAGAHQEPTWGDVSKANLIAGGLGTSNQAQLVSAFGSASTISDLQLCRNASAHVSGQTIAEITAAKVRYSQTRFLHASDLIYWVAPQTNAFLWKTWIDEIEVTADLAVT